MRNVRVVTLALIAVFLGAACGEPAVDSRAGDLIAASADATTESGTARMTMQMSMTSPQASFDLHAKGVWDFADRLGRMTMNMDMPNGPEASGAVVMVFHDLVIYMKYPALTQAAPNMKPWLRMDLEKAGDEMGMDLGAMMQAGNSDPTQILHYLRGVSGDVEVVGEEEVRGLPATHYRGLFDLDKMVENAPPELRDRLASTVDTIDAVVGTGEIPFDVWIDDQGRAVRIMQSFDYTEGPQAGSEMSMTMEMLDFGADVTVKIPPASQTSDFQELMDQMGAPAP